MRARLEREFEDAVRRGRRGRGRGRRAREAGSRARARAARGDASRRWRARASPRRPTCGSPGEDEEALAHEAEPEAAAALRREAVLAAIVEAEQIEPTDEQVPRGARARPPSAQGTTAEKLLEQLAPPAGSTALRERRRRRARRSSCWSAEAKPISVEQAKARKKLWTPGQGSARGKDPDSSGLPAANPVERRLDQGHRRPGPPSRTWAVATVGRIPAEEAKEART